MSNDTTFQMSHSNLRFGRGATAEVGYDLLAMSAKRTMVIIDPHLRYGPTGEQVTAALRQQNLDFDIFDDVSIEPTDLSLLEAGRCVAAGKFDAVVAVGGGSTIDTAKAASLLASYPSELLRYVSPPIGRGRQVPGPIKPVIAIPTTAGTGSETTGVAVFDLRSRGVKTGISHRHLRPVLGIVDVDNTRTLPPPVAASTGLDVLSHALESYTALPYDQRPRPASPLERPAYQGANPLSDIWALHALRLLGEHLPRAVRDTSDEEARGAVMMAASIAGIGFGNAGVHLPHAMAYPVASMIEEYQPPGYAVDHPMVPHGISVILHTPAVARFTAPAAPRRHLQAAAALGADTSDAGPDDAGEVLAERVLELMRMLHMPDGLSALDYSEEDIPRLVDGTLAQQRLTQVSPRPVGRDELSELFRQSMELG